MKTTARLLAFLSLAACSLMYARIRAPLDGPRGPLLLLKLLAGALTPFVALCGALAAALGLAARAPVAVLAGTLGAAVAAREVRRVTAPGPGCIQASGIAWDQAAAPDCATGAPRHRWTWPLPPAPTPRWQRDVPFWTLSDAGCTLLCDLWQPPCDVAPSGLALVYLHGSAWSVLDKDVGTRPFFRHLAAQGHVVMDVAYRLYPETDLRGMVGDARRAIAWIKAHAPDYGVNPRRVVLAGASAGGHLALLAAYTAGLPALTPDDVGETDVSVRAVISCYGPTDLAAYYDYTRQDSWPPPAARPPRPAPPARSPLRVMFGPDSDRLRLDNAQDVGAMEPMLGGTPRTVPERYALFSPGSHVHPGCPPTLLIQGEHDALAPVAATRRLYADLVAAGVPAVNVVFPHADHGFDLIFPRWSPLAQAALCAQDRFLALML
jgi:acetyl esterase/lipase